MTLIKHIHSTFVSWYPQQAKIRTPPFSKGTKFYNHKVVHFFPASCVRAKGYASPQTQKRNLRIWQRKLIFQTHIWLGGWGHLHFVWGLSMCFTFWEMVTTPSWDGSSRLRIHAAIEATGPSHGPRSFNAPSLVMKDALKGMKGKSLIFFW